MAEEKKTSSRGRKPRKKRATPVPQKEGFSLRNEVKGLIIIGFAILALLGYFNGHIPLWIWLWGLYSMLSVIMVRMALII